MYTVIVVKREQRKTIKIEVRKETFHNVPDFSHSSHKFYGYAFVNHKRMGTVWKNKSDGHYVFNEDFDIDSTRRSYQATGRTLAILKDNIKALY